MQIFLPYPEPIKVAQCLDKRRLNRQVQEAIVIFKAIMGEGKGWFNHPVVKMYKPYYMWLRWYMQTLSYYQQGEIGQARLFSDTADIMRPDFFCEDLYIAHRRRLYTKMPEYYKEFAKYGKSEENMYYVDGKFIKYVNGKRV